MQGKLRENDVENSVQTLSFVFIICFILHCNNTQGTGIETVLSTVLCGAIIWGADNVYYDTCLNEI